MTLKEITKFTQIELSVRSQSNMTLRQASFLRIRAYQDRVSSKLSEILNQIEMLNKITVA